MPAPASFDVAVGATDIAAMSAAALGRVARRSLAEGNLNETLWQQYADRTSQLADGLSLEEAGRLTSCLALARTRNFDLFSRLASRALACVRESPEGISHQELLRLAVSFGRASMFDSELMEELVPLIVERVESFRPRDLVQIAEAYARMPVQNVELFGLVAEALPPYLYDLEALQVAKLTRAFAEAAIYNEELTDAICAEVVKRLRSFGASECLIFLDALAHLKVSLPKELRRDDSATVAAVASHLRHLLGALGPLELVRLFRALVQLDYYDRSLVHSRICEVLTRRLGQLSGPSLFSDLAELLHCLSLLPAQSHTSAELVMTTITRMRRQGVPTGGRPEIRAVTLAAAALAQLGHEDDDLLRILATAVAPQLESEAFARDARKSSPTEMLPLASEEELAHLRRAFTACRGDLAAAVVAAVVEEQARRTMEPQLPPDAAGAAEPASG